MINEPENDTMEARGGNFIQDPTTGKMMGSEGSGNTEDAGGSKTDADPAGENSLEVKGFRNKQALNNHWENGRTHKDEYAADGITDAKQYQERAVKLLESKTSENVLGHVDKHGHIIRYDREKNDFAKGSATRGVLTMFKPIEGEAYYEKMRKGDLANGGKS